ncbi:MAG: hypothetical protein IJV64_13705 [Oscillospiraceae bacterium]|nr:hypothetical protein [Oscillospiraceae bacterium]
MIMDKKGETFTAEGKAFSVGGMVWANDESDYRGLLGYVAEIRDGCDKETDNEGVDIYCDFLTPTKPHLVREIESRFSKLYQMPKRIDELPLGGVIMASEMLEPIADVLPESEGAMYALVYTYDGESDSTIGMVGISQDKAVLMRALFDDLDRFEEDEGYKAVLSSTSRFDDRETFTFEPADVEESSFTLEYIIFEVPAYGALKGGAAA